MTLLKKISIILFLEASGLIAFGIYALFGLGRGDVFAISIVGGIAQVITAMGVGVVDFLMEDSSPI